MGALEVAKLFRDQTGASDTISAWMLAHLLNLVTCPGPRGRAARLRNRTIVCDWLHPDVDRQIANLACGYMLRRTGTADTVTNREELVAELVAFPEQLQVREASAIV